MGNTIYHSILTGLAVGDRRTNSAFKRANISFDNGIDMIDKLCDRDMIILEKSLQHLSCRKFHKVVSEKLLFTTPFARFWFSFVSPLFKGIRDSNYDEVMNEYKNKNDEFPALIFEQLSHEVLKKNFVDDKIIELGRYWDDDIDIDILGKTKSGKIIVGSCKYTNSKVNKSELSKLKEKCKQAEIIPDIFILFSKKGYSRELKNLKGETLKLYTPRNFNQLIKL